VVYIKDKKNKEKSNRKMMNLRVVLAGIVMTFGFIIVVGSLSIIEFVHGEEYSRKAYNQQVKNQIISPKRGTIYDSNGEVLAQSIAVDTVSLNPGKVKYYNNKTVQDELIAEGLSNIFNVTHEELMEKLDSDRSVIIVERKVGADKVTELREWMTEKRNNNRNKYR